MDNLIVVISDIRDIAPVLLVPSAWVVSFLAISGAFRQDTVMVAHLVMVLFIGFFIATGYDNMRSGALRGWLVVLCLGFSVTVAGLVGFYTTDYTTLLHTVSIFGWMILPTAGLLYTGLKTDKRLYYIASGMSLIGVILVITPVGFFGIFAVAVGHSIGIWKAVADEQKDDT
jgi:hypothetical protein